MEKYNLLLNNLLGRQNKQTVVNELNVNEDNLTSPEEISDGFNNHFSNIGPDLASKIDTSNYNFGTKSEFAAFQPATVSRICCLLNDLSGNKATGIDKISCNFFKIAAPAISDLLTPFFNLLLYLLFLINGK